MKYNELLSYRDFLTTAGGLATASAESYYKAMATLLSDQNVLSCANMDIDKVLEKFRAIQHKSTYAKYKNAFLKFCDYQGIQVSSVVSKELKDMSSIKKKKRRKVKPVTLKNIKDKLRVTSDKRLKLSFETMLNMGLRVSELSKIKKENCILEHDNIIIRFLGKGGNNENVLIRKVENEKFYDHLFEWISKIKDNEKVFYSTNYLQKQAIKKGFKCHDLRRAYAKLEYIKCRNVNEVSKKLRHSNIKTTKIYLKSNVEIE